MKFGEEVERIIQLQVTVATVNVSIIVALHKVRNRVDVGIVHETDTVAATLAVRLGVLIEPVEKHGVSGIAAYDRDIAVDRLGRVVRNRLINSAFCTEMVAYVITFHIKADTKMVIEELGCEVETGHHAVHLGSLDNTV